jgi:Flp pilus assembly protein TadG
MKQTIRDSKGQTLVLVALAMMVLLGMAALALDAGNLYLQRRQAQTAADAGALAAARVHCQRPNDTAAWKAAGNTFCSRNATTPYGLTCDTQLGTAGSVRTTASTSVDLWFAGVFGMASTAVRAEAEASCDPIVETGTVLPLTIPIEDFSLGASYLLWNKDAGGKGSFGWLEWPDPLDPGCPGNHGANRLKGCIEEPWCAPPIAIGDWIQTETGAINSALEGHLWPRWQCQTVVIPLYDGDNGKSGSNKEYRVGAFGAFYLTGMCKNKNEANACPGYSPPACSGGDTKVSGIFVGYVEPDSIPGQSDSTVYTVYLRK